MPSDNSIQYQLQNKLIKLNICYFNCKKYVTKVLVKCGKLNKIKVLKSEKERLYEFLIILLQNFGRIIESLLLHLVDLEQGTRKIFLLRV